MYDVLVISIDQRELARVQLPRVSGDIASLLSPPQAIEVNLDGRVIAECVASHLPRVIDRNGE